MYVASKCSSKEVGIGSLIFTCKEASGDVGGSIERAGEGMIRLLGPDGDACSQLVHDGAPSSGIL